MMLMMMRKYMVVGYRSAQKPTRVKDNIVPGPIQEWTKRLARGRTWILL
jgi:hypothetical protein